MKFIVLLTGQNKKPSVFNQSNSIYNKLIKGGVIDEVVVSIWNRDYKTMYPYIKDYTILKEEIPNLTIKLKNGEIDKKNSGLGVGNIWPQMRSFESGINYIHSKYEDAIVLKTRPDVLISEKLIKEIKSDIIKQTVNCKKTGIKHKIWIPWFDLTKPFYVADECFCGHVYDLKKMINYNYKDYPKHFQGISHVRRLINPFINHYPELKNYIKNGGNCLYDISCQNVWDVRKSNTLKHLKTKTYKTFLAHYYYILHKYFHVKVNNYEVLFRPWNSAINSKINPNKTIEENVKTIQPIANSLILGYDNIFIKNINENKITEEYIYNKILKLKNDE